MAGRAVAQAMWWNRREVGNANFDDWARVPRRQVREADQRSSNSGPAGQRLVPGPIARNLAFTKMCVNRGSVLNWIASGSPWGDETPRVLRGWGDGLGLPH